MALRMKSSDLYTLGFGWPIAISVDHINYLEQIEHVSLNADFSKVLNAFDLLGVHQNVLGSKSNFKRID